MGETAKSQSKEVKKKDVKKKDPPSKADKPAEKAEKKDDKKATEKKVKPKVDEKPEKPAKKETKAKAPEPKAEKGDKGDKGDKAKDAKDAKVTEAKKRKKDEKEKEKVKEGKDTRKMQEGAVEVDDAEPESAPRQKRPKGACAAEALDVDEGMKNGKAAKTSKKLGQADREDRSRSQDSGEVEEKPKAKPEKEKDRGKTKEKETPKAKAPEKEKPEKVEKVEKVKERRSKGQKSSYSSEESSGGAAKRRQQRRADAGLKAASGFSLTPVPAAEPGSSFGPAPNPLAVSPSVPAPVQSLLGTDVTSELVRMRQAVEAATGKPVEPRLRLDQREEEQETKLKMTEELREGLLDPANQKQLLARTSLLSATLAEDGQVVLRAPSKQALKDAMSVLARIAHHCMWGCNSTKVGLLLREKPEQPVHTVLVRLAATSSRMQTQEGRVNQRQEKLRVGTDPAQCQIALEPIAGISRKHLTITFEYDKGGCYVQDMSTNGTRLNGKRLPRPPYKHPMDARVRIFHGDELVLAITPEGEELGFVVNLFELSG